MYLTDLERFDAAHARSQQTDLGPSDTGRCLRQSAYAMFATEPDDDAPLRSQALFGSLLHLGWSAMIVSLGDDQREADVPIAIPGLRAVGHADDVDYRHRIVDDLKSVSARAWERWVTYEVRADAWDQVELYAYGLICADESPTPQPWMLRITALNRETGQVAEFERESDPEKGAVLAERLVDRQIRLDTAESPDDIPREGAGPERGFPCDWCPYLSTCWPDPVDGLTPQAVTVADDPTMIAAIGEDYLAAAEVARKADAAKKDARAFLGGIPAGDYGDVRLSWRGGRPLGEEPDPAAMQAVIAGLGLDVPTRQRRSAVSIHVARVPPTAKVDASQRVEPEGSSNLGGSDVGDDDGPPAGTADRGSDHD